MANPKENTALAQIRATADLYPPATYGLGSPSIPSFLTYYKDLEIHGDSHTSHFIPFTSVRRNTKLFAVGILPPTQTITGRLQDRTRALPVKDLTGVDPRAFFVESDSLGSLFGDESGMTPERQQVLDIAEGELGKSDWTKYLGNVVPPPSTKVSWCGIFACWALGEAGYNVHWKLGVGFQPPLTPTRNPKPGDIIYLQGELHHYGIIKSIEGDTIHTIDGNSYGRKVFQNTRSIEEVAAFYSIDSLPRGPVTLPENSHRNSPVGSDVDSTSTWKDNGSRRAQDANTYQDLLANTDIQKYQDLLDTQKGTIEAARSALASMANAPPLRLLVNPNKFSVKSQKIVQDGNWGRNGPIVEFWGDDQDKISGSGQIAAFYSLLTNPSLGQGGPGLTRAARNHSEAWQNLQSLWLLYRNNGGLYTKDVSQQDRDSVLSTVGSVYIFYDNILYIGCFDSFNISETDTKPFTAEYNFEFTVRVAFLLDFPPEDTFEQLQRSRRVRPNFAI